MFPLARGPTVLRANGSICKIIFHLLQTELCCNLYPFNNYSLLINIFTCSVYESTWMSNFQLQFFFLILNWRLSTDLTGKIIYGSFFLVHIRGQNLTSKYPDFLRKGWEQMTMMASTRRRITPVGFAQPATKPNFWGQSVRRIAGKLQLNSLTPLGLVSYFRIAPETRRKVQYKLSSTIY